MKYKHSLHGFIKKIDGESVTEFHPEKKKGLKKEMDEWIAAGNEIEPEETAQEKTDREAREQQQSLVAQKEACERYLDETQYIVTGDCDYPQADINAEKIRRAEVKAIMRGSTIQILPMRDKLV